MSLIFNLNRNLGIFYFSSMLKKANSLTVKHCLINHILPILWLLYFPRSWLDTTSNSLLDDFITLISYTYFCTVLNVSNSWKLYCNIFSESVDWEFANKEIKEQYGIDLKHEKEIMQRKLMEGIFFLNTFNASLILKKSEP